MKDTNKPTGAQSLDGVEPVSETTDRVKRVEKPEPPVAEDPSPESLNPYQPEELWIDLNKVHAARASKSSSEIKGRPSPRLMVSSRSRAFDRKFLTDASR
jgi:hypothetical protein